MLIEMYGTKALWGVAAAIVLYLIHRFRQHSEWESMHAHRTQQADAFGDHLRAHSAKGVFDEGCRFCLRAAADGTHSVRPAERARQRAAKERRTD